MKATRESILTLVERAMRGADALPVTELASLNEAASCILRRVDPQRAKQADHIANLLRQALGQQLEFTALLAD